MKKLVSVLLCLALVIAMATGCGNNGTQQSTDSSGDQEGSEEMNDQGSSEVAEEPSGSEDGQAEAPSGEGDFTIGYNYFGSGSYALLSLANNSRVVIDAFGNSAVAMDNEFSVEKIIQDVENMISTGVDGIIIWLPAETLYTTVADMCAAAEIPFVLNDKIPSDESIIKALQENPYFAGAVAPANAEYGSAIANYALAKGYMTCIISSSGIGDASDSPRLEAFLEVYEAGGGTVLDELHSDSTDAAQQQIENSLIANSEVDFIYGVGSDFGIAACGALQNMGIEAKVLTSGLDSEALSLLKDGTYMEMVSGDFWVSGMFSAVVLQNYLDGTPLVDDSGNAAWIDDVMPFEVPAEQMDLYQKFFIDQYCYTPEEIRQFSGKTNSDFDFAAFRQLIDDYSLENRLKARYEDGSVTAEELEAAGISFQ